MQFKLEASNLESVAPEHRPWVSVVGLPFSSQLGNWLLKGAQESLGEFEIPDEEPIVAVFRVWFPTARRTIDLAARLFRAQGAAVRLQKSDFVSIDIRHEAGTVAQCIVTCLITGESRSGAGACIDCSDGQDTVRICC